MTAARRPLLALLTALLSLTAARAQQLDHLADHPGAIRYTLDLAHAAQHELRITVAFPAVGTDVFTVRMPSASPGRYARHDFAKNVYDLTATGADGDTLEVHAVEPGAWAVTGHGGAVTLAYTLFADYGDGTYAGVDDRKLHLNMPAVFVFGERLTDRPVLLQIGVDGEEPQRPNWTVATQLVPVAGNDRLRAAPDYAYFYDSPTFVGDITRAGFDVANPDGLVQRVEVAMIHEGTRAEFDDYLRMVARVVEAEQAVYGELPRFDYGRYTFLCAYNPYVGGDGMEHRNSTVCSSRQSLAEAADRLIGTVAHEFFHAWNVERIRPATLEPFDFTHANMSGELWFAEGFTSYYDDLSLVRAGILAPADYAANLERQLNYVLLAPGRRHRSPVEMSQQAYFVDAATANDPDNFANTFVSYYGYGATLGLALDLELRRRGHTLDEVMRLAWRRYGATEIPYHVRDLELVVGDVAEDRDWAAGWFERHVYASAVPALAPLLADYGFALRQAAPDSAGFFRLGLRQNTSRGEGDAGTVYVEAPVLETSPLYGAGLGQGDTLRALNGQPIDALDDWRAAVGELQIGETYELRFTHLGREKTGSFVAEASPALRLTLTEDPTTEQLAARRQWLRSGD